MSTGKLLNPKFGVVKVIVEEILSGRVKDVILCPISIGYDRVLETESYVEELLGAEKTKESLSQFLSSAKLLNLKLGRIDVTFAKPFSLRGYIDAQMLGRRDFNPAKNPGDQLLLLKSVAFRVLSDINNVSVIMPTALVGTCLLTLRGRGVSKTEVPFTTLPFSRESSSCFSSSSSECSSRKRLIGYEPSFSSEGALSRPSQSKRFQTSLTDQ